MENNRGRRNESNLHGDNNKSVTFYIIGIVVVIAIIAFIITYSLINNNKTQTAKITNSTKIADTNTMRNINEITSETSSSMGKTINEIQNKDNTQSTNTVENKESINTTEKIAVNTSNKNNEDTNTLTEKSNIKDSNSNNNTTVEKETQKDPAFIAPIEGEKTKDYAEENLVYSNTLSEWTTHLGIDYKAEKTDIVKASADGTVKSIKNDPRYGLTVIIEHTNGFSSMYANLLSTEFIEVGEEVKQGDTIATVGNTASFEIADETHLHFEILKDGIEIDPNIYIK